MTCSSALGTIQQWMPWLGVCKHLIWSENRELSAEVKDRSEICNTISFMSITIQILKRQLRGSLHLPGSPST